MQQHGDQPTKQSKLKINIWYKLYMGSFFFFRAIHAVYRSSQARGQIRATAASHTPQPQLPAYTTATARPDLNCVCKLHCSSQQHQIFNPLSVARDQTCILMSTCQVRFCWATVGTPCGIFEKWYKWTYLQNRKRHKQRKQTYGYQKVSPFRRR